MRHSEQKCAHFYSEWCIVVYGTGALWDLWDWSIECVDRDGRCAGSLLQRVTGDRSREDNETQRNIMITDDDVNVAIFCHDI